MNQLQSVLFNLLQFQISTTLNGYIPSNIDWNALYALSKKHELAHLIGDAIIKLNIDTNRDSAVLFETQLFDAHYRVERYQYAFQEICQLFEQEKIPFLPLKGLVLRSFYPETWMRTSCDMDILVHSEDLKRAEEILSNNLQYKIKNITPHDISFLSSDGVHLELHHSLVEKKRAADSNRILEQVWKYSKPLGDSRYHFVMDKAMFYFYHIAHMAKHFENGGCGIRSVFDLWLMEQQRDFWSKDSLQLLKQGGLLTFASAMRNLAQIWFSHGTYDPLLLMMEEFILSGGIYGSSKQQYSIRAYRSKGKWKYLLSRIFIPYSDLKYQYPILFKHMYLFPFCQLHRWFSLLCSEKSQKRKDTLKKVTSITEQQITEVSYLLNQLEL